MMLETLRQALQNVWANKLRTFLTMLGIIIGVMAVIVIVGLGNGMTVMLNGLYNTMNGDLLGVSLYTFGSRTVSVNEMYSIVEKYPQYFSGVTPMEYSDEKARVGTEELRHTGVLGTDERYFAIGKYTLAAGRGLTWADQEDCKPVCVVGDYVARAYFGGDAVGRTLKIGPDVYRVVGVLAAKGSEGKGGSDDRIFVPYTTLMRLAHKNSVSGYYVLVRDPDKTAQGKAALEAELKRRIGPEDEVSVSALSEEIQSLRSMIDIVVAVLTAIAGISLLVGGIGIMNIMLVSVTERTREIGIRKALGAKERVILAQFVAEAAVTSAVGGGIGIALGYAVSAAANLIVPGLTASMGTEFSVVPSPTAAATAFGISTGIGVLFGYLPARRAARLNPIEALRYD